MAGEIIDRDLRQKNLPFYTGNEDPYGRGVIIQNQKYGIFTFKKGDPNIRKTRLGVFPDDHLKHQKDLGSLLQVKIPGTGSKGAITIDDVIEEMPEVQIREYTQDTRVDYVLSIAKIFVKGLTDGEKAASGTFDFGTIREAFGLMIHDVKTPNSPFWTNIGNVLSSHSVFGGYGDEKDKKALIDFVYALYYEMVSTTSTNMYTLPFNVQDNVMKGNGADGWDSFSMNGAFMEHMGALTGFLGKGISIYTTPVWQGIKNREGYGFDTTINLFNDTLEHTLANFIFVNTIIPQNMPTHYAIFQQAPSLYDIKIPGFQRLFMCSGDFSCSMKGCLRKPSDKFLERLLVFANTKYGFKKDESPIKDIRIPDVYEVHLSFKSLLPNTFNNFIFQYVNVKTSMETMLGTPLPGWGEDNSIPNAIGEWGKERFKDGEKLSKAINGIQEDHRNRMKKIDKNNKEALKNEMNRYTFELKDAREASYLPETTIDPLTTDIQAVQPSNITGNA